MKPASGIAKTRVKGLDKTETKLWAG